MTEKDNLEREWRYVGQSEGNFWECEKGRTLGKQRDQPGSAFHTENKKMRKKNKDKRIIGKYSRYKNKFCET